MRQRPDPSELAILRRFEPVVRYTRGERFFPVDIERYIQECSLWVQKPDEPAELLVPQGELNLERLVEPRQSSFGTVYFLKFIDPLDLVQYAKYSLDQVLKSLGDRDPLKIFRAGRGRLARVGYTSRFVDAVFSFSLFMRGRVPGDTAAAAALTYHQMQSPVERYCYYGRVVRENGWVALQYWYFYPFNNWRSGFFGVNDHEADWEMVTVYCYENDSEGVNEKPLEERLVPQWVAYASHDFSGDDLRRRWDDPEVEKVGDHPVVYAGAGSHASYFARGEYLSELELPFLSPLASILVQIRRIWVGWLRQAGLNAREAEISVFSVPFVDYARGDGLSIGPGQYREWEPLRLDESSTWAMEYRGLWGLYARDPISGENAPAGPVYNRDGSVRHSWYDPIGWAGLDKQPPPHEAFDVLQKQRYLAQERCEALRQEVAETSAELYGLGMEVAALYGVPHLESIYTGYVEKVEALSQKLSELRRQLTIEQAKIEAFGQHAQRLQLDQSGPLRAHIRRAHMPSTQIDLRLSSLAEGFAAVSIGLVMVSIVLLIVFAREYLIFGLAAMIGLLIFVEAGFRRKLSQLISSMVIGMAIVSAFILLFEFFWQVVVLCVLMAGLYIMWENVREVRSF